MSDRRRFSVALRRGFTLIELMIAVTILGLILVMLASSFHTVAAGKTQGEYRIATGEQTRMVIWELSNELRGAMQLPNTSVLFLGVGSMANNTPLDSLTLSTLDPGHRRTLEGFGAEDTVSYATAPNPNHRGWYLLTRTQSSSLLTNGDGGAQPVVVADNLLALHFRYFDGNLWTESWNSASLPPNRQLPQAVTIDLVLATATGAPLRLSTMVTLPMAFTQW